MNFVTNPNEYSAVNLDRIDMIRIALFDEEIEEYDEKNENGKYFIIFYFNNGAVTWEFDTQEERDKVLKLNNLDTLFNI